MAILNLNLERTLISFDGYQMFFGTIFLFSCCSQHVDVATLQSVPAELELDILDKININFIDVIFVAK